MTPEKPTPRPWRLALPGERIAFTDCHIACATGRPIATTIYPLAPGHWRGEDKANALLIVQSVNAHYDLLAALRAFVSVVKSRGHSPAYLVAEDGGYALHPSCMDCIVLEQAYAAIAKATSPQAQ